MLLSISTLAILTERATLRVTVVTMLLFTQTPLFLALLPRILKFEGYLCQLPKAGPVSGAGRARGVIKVGFMACKT